MTSELGLIAGAVLVVAISGFCTALASRIIYSAVGGWHTALPPAARASFLLVWALAPLLVALLILALVLSPSLGHLLGLGTDHCHTHSHHAHFCLQHTTYLTGSVLEWLILFFAAAFMLVATLKVGARLHKGRRALRALLAFVEQPTADLPYRLVNSQRPFAITAGLMKPEVLISKGLRDRLKPDEFATVAFHESAHQRRRDGIRLFVAETLSSMHFPATRRSLLYDLGLAIEQACDEAAAMKSGDRLRVAETIVKLARLVGSFKPDSWIASPSITGSDLVLRVEALLNPAQPTRRWHSAAAYSFGGILIAMGLASNAWWHHTAESLLGSFLG